MNLNGRTELLIGVAIIVVLALAVIALLIVPQFGQMGEYDRQLAKANADVQAAQALLAQRQSAKSAAAETQARLLALQNELPDNPELPSLIIELQNTANQAGLVWVKVEPQIPQDRGGFVAVPLQLTMEGSWADMNDYVRRIGRLERQMRITSVDIKPKEDPSSATADTAASSSTKASTGPIPLTSSIQLEAYVMGTSTGTSVPSSPSGASTGQ
jgi:type IV pilus assembly protein PilO